MRSDFIKASKDFLVYGIGSVVSQILSILMLPIYTRWLGINEYGVLALLMGIMNVLMVLAQSGLTSALFRSYYDYDDMHNQGRLIGTTLWLLLMATTFISVSTFLFGDLITGLIDTVSIKSGLIRIIACTVFVGGLNSLPSAIFRCRRQAIRQVITALISLLSSLSFIIYFVVVRKMGVQGVLYGGFIGACITFLVGYSQVVGLISFRIKWNEVRKLLRFGMPLVPANLAVWVLGISGQFFLARYSTLADVGIYALANRISRIVSILVVGPLFLLWLPVMLSVHKKDYAKQFYARMLNYYLIVSTFISLGLSIYSREVLMFLATEEFINSHYYVFPLCMTVVIYGTNRLLNVGTDLQRKSENTAFALIASVIFFIGLNLILIPMWGISGLVTAGFLAYSLNSTLVFVLANRLYPIRYEWIKALLILFVASVIYVSSLLIEILFDQSILMVITIKFILILLFPAILFFMKIIGTQERKEAKHQWLRLVSFLRQRLMLN